MTEMKFSKQLSAKTKDLCIRLMKYSQEKVNPNKIVEKFENCHRLFCELITLQEEFSYVTLESVEDFHEQRFLNLQKLTDELQNKQCIHKVKVQFTSNDKGHGVVSTGNIEKYEKVMEISENLMITESGAYNSSFGEFLNSNELTRSLHNVGLALYLLNECFNKNSLHRHYINSLPMSMNTVLYLTPSQLKLLQHSQFLSEIVQQFTNICSHYCYLYLIFEKTKTIKGCNFYQAFCLNDFRWAVSIVMSRNNSIPTCNGQSKMLALIPFWDMMNHEPKEVTTDFDIDRNCLIYYSMSDYAEGDEVCMDYGSRTTLHYFIFSGFVPLVNIYDSYCIRIAFNSASDDLYKKKREILRRLSIDCDNPIFVINYLRFECLGKALSSYLAVMLVKEESVLDSILNAESFFEDELSKLQTLFAENILNVFTTRIKLTLDIIKRTIERSGDDVMNNCMKLLLHERTVLESVLAKCNSC